MDKLEEIAEKFIKDNVATNEECRTEEEKQWAAIIRSAVRTSFKAGYAARQGDVDSAYEKGFSAAKITEEVTHKSCCCEISSLQSQLDEVTKVKERYEKALDIISKNKHIDYDENHYECGNYDDSYNHGYEVGLGECGDVAREALNGARFDWSKKG